MPMLAISDADCQLLAEALRFLADDLEAGDPMAATTTPEESAKAGRLYQLADRITATASGQAAAKPSVQDRPGGWS